MKLHQLFDPPADYRHRLHRRIACYALVMLAGAGMALLGNSARQDPEIAVQNRHALMSLGGILIGVGIGAILRTVHTLLDKERFQCERTAEQDERNQLCIYRAGHLTAIVSFVLLYLAAAVSIFVYPPALLPLLCVLFAELILYLLFQFLFSRIL